MSLFAFATILAAYLLGSISSAVLICRLWRLPDPRQQGSNNPGATNVYRLGGALPAFLTFWFDMLKGTIPVWGGYFLGLPPLILGLVAVAACLGHMYPLFFGFRGGKGVATALGALFPIGWTLGLALIMTWLLVVAISGYSSLGAVIAVLLAPLYTWLLKPQYTLPVIMLSILIIWRHLPNIRRLLRGQESRIWDKRQRPEN